MPARDSLACKGLPIGLAHGIKLIHAVDRGTVVTWQNVAGPDNDAARFRREMEAEFAGKL
jgi:predicted homoserine dehydrogenase-like protein